MKTNFILVTILIARLLSAQTDTIDYFGQTPPGDSAVIFAPGIICKTGRHEHAPRFSPDGKEFYFSVEDNDWLSLTTYSTHYDNGIWSEPEKSFFSTIMNNCTETFISYDNHSIYFVHETGSTDDPYISDFWKADRDSLGNWGMPVKMCQAINDIGKQWHIAVAASNNIYFSSAGEIYFSEFIGDSTYAPPQKINSELINTSAWDAEVFIAPDESYMIFTRASSLPNRDILITYKNAKGEWTNPKSVGESVNSNIEEFGPYVSPDNRYFFFARKTNDEVDIYWIDAGFIDSLKNTNFIPYLRNNIPDQTIRVNDIFNFTIPDSIFTDDDGNETLTFSAKLSNNDDLPEWLIFDTITYSFSGTPVETGHVDIQIKATDTAGASVSDIFRLVIKEDARTYEQVKFNLRIVVYPNPTNNTLYITYPGLSEKEAYYKLIDLNGKTRLQGKLTGNTIDVSKLSKGFYLFTLNVDYKTISKKIVVE